MFTDENTQGFTEEELDKMNYELNIRLVSVELKELDESERIKIISERILDKY